MQYRSAKGFTGGAQFAIFFGLILVGLFATGLVQFVIGLMLMPPNQPLGSTPNAMMKVLMDPKNVGWMRLAQVVGTFFIMFLPSALYSLITNGKSFFWLGFNRYINWQQVVLAFLLIFLANIVAGPLADLSKKIIDQIPELKSSASQLEDTYNEQVKAMGHLTSWGEYLVSVLIIAFLPAVFEEMCFRGSLQNILVKWWQRPLLGIIVTSVVFSIIHMSIYLFLSRAVLGLVLGLLFFKSRNIWVNILAHFMNNAIAVTELFRASHFSKSKNIDINNLDPKVDWWVGVLALIVMYFLFRVFDKYSAANRSRALAQEQMLLAQADPFKGIAHATEN